MFTLLDWLHGRYLVGYLVGDDDLINSDETASLLRYVSNMARWTLPADCAVRLRGHIPGK